MGRMAVPAIAIEILAIALASESWTQLGDEPDRSFLLSAATALSLFAGAPALSRLVESLDRPERGPIVFLSLSAIPKGARTVAVDRSTGSVRLANRADRDVADGAGEEHAEATCIVPASREALILDVAGGALAALLPAGRLRVSIDGRVATMSRCPGRVGPLRGAAFREPRRRPKFV